MTYNVFSGTLNPTHSLTHTLPIFSHIAIMSHYCLVDMYNNSQTFCLMRHLKCCDVLYVHFVTHFCDSFTIWLLCFAEYG